MKSQSKLRFIILLLCTITLLSCKKTTDVEPASITEKLAGRYTMSELIIGNQTLNLPYKQGTDELNGTIDIEKISATKITLNYTINTILKGVKETDTAEDTFFVKQGKTDLELFEDEAFTTQIGSLADGKTLYIVSNVTDRITAIKN